MFEMAADFAKYNTEFEVVGGYLSPVSDAYRKAGMSYVMPPALIDRSHAAYIILGVTADSEVRSGLASAEHRVAMTRIATDQSSRWLDVDPWEAIQKEYQPTAIVLDHFEHEINVVQRGIAIRGGQRKAVKIVLLAGADLIQTMSTPGTCHRFPDRHCIYWSLSQTVTPGERMAYHNTCSYGAMLM